MTPKELFKLMTNAKTSSDAQKAEDMFKETFVNYNDNDKKEILGRMALGEYSMSTVNKTKEFIDRVVNLVPSNIVVDELGSLYCTLIAMVCLSKVLAKKYKSVEEMDLDSANKSIPDGEMLFELGKEMFEVIQPIISDSIIQMVEKSFGSDNNADKSGPDNTN